MECPDQTARRMSFNPQAATFSPTMASASVAETSNTVTGQFETTAGQGTAALEQLPMEALLAQGIPMEVLMRTLAEHPTISVQDLLGSSSNTYALPQQDADYAAGIQLAFMFPSQPTEPNLSIVDIDELSASLGLPSARKALKNDGSPTHIHKSHASQGVPDVLYGKLIDKALNKPLTANTLAHYMKSRSESSEETVKPAHSPHDPFVDYGMPTEEQGPALKAVQPPPGFGVKMPRMVPTKDENTYTGAMNHRIAVAQAAVPPGYFHQRPRLNQAVGPNYPLQHHSRHPSGRRHPRRYTHTKRTDQGPEPSAADIYPDDAHWTPTQQPLRQNYFSPPSPIVHTEDAASWPTPAEVFQSKPLAFTPNFALHPLEPHISPTVQDRIASDADVHFLLHDLRDPGIPTLITSGAYNPTEERSMSPDQKSGKRYGLRFYGIGLADEWQPPKHWGGPSDRYRADPFRVRPRDHEGWGGWEWAIKNAWTGAA